MLGQVAEVWGDDAQEIKARLLVELDEFFVVTPSIKPHVLPADGTGVFLGPSNDMLDEVAAPEIGVRHDAVDVDGVVLVTLTPDGAVIESDGKNTGDLVVYHDFPLPVFVDFLLNEVVVKAFPVLVEDLFLVLDGGIVKPKNAVNILQGAVDELHRQC